MLFMAMALNLSGVFEIGLGLQTAAGNIEMAGSRGETLAGHILEIVDASIKVDFNHPLADLAIEFEVEIFRIL